VSTGLTKAEVNERFYNTVGGEILFETEAQSFNHPLAVARLIAAYANASGRRELKILEIGANDCVFATSLLKLITQLRVHGEATVSKVEYFAVEYARRSLEAALGRYEHAGFDEVTPGAAESPLVGSLTRLGPPQLALYLVHAEANQFLTGATGRFDLVILNELLDDLPCRAFYSDAAGVKRELVVHARPKKSKWLVTVSAAETGDAKLADMPPSTLTVTSAESLGVVRGAAALLESGGMLVVHDYGFADPYVSLSKYEEPPKALPEFVTVEFPDAGDDPFPRSFFRIFGSESGKVVQITTDLNFAELTAALEGDGRVITLPHGNSKLAQRDPSGEDYLRKDDGIFLSEFATLGVGDDLHALISRLHEEQGALRESFAREYLPQTASLYADLLFVKD
jgi:putative S-adenosyl-L-methionine-dependent methyltransferase